MTETILLYYLAPFLRALSTNGFKKSKSSYALTLLFSLKAALYLANFFDSVF